MVTHDIAAVKLDDTDTLDTAQRLHRPRQAAVALVRQVDLRNVPRDDELGITAHTRQEHLDLRHGRILRLVQYDESVIKRTAAHVCQRRNLNRPLLDILLQLGRGDHIVQRIVQRLQVRVELLLHVTGQESQLLPRLDSRARQNHAPHLPILQCAHRQRYGRICLARACGPHGKEQVVVLVKLDQTPLVNRTRTHRDAVIAENDGILVRHGLHTVAQSRREGLRHNLLRDVTVLYIIVDERIHLALESLNIGLRPQHTQRRAARHDLHLRGQRPYLLHVDVLCAVEFARVDTLYGDQFVYLFSIHTFQNI